MDHDAGLRAAEEARIRAAYARRDRNDFRYSWFNPAYQLMIQQRERHCLVLLSRFGCAHLESMTILDVGCGTGQWLRDFVKWGAQPENLFGIDLLRDRVQQAARLCPPAVHLQCGTAEKLDFESERFDIVLQSTVFTSILDPSMKERIAAEMMRVVKPGGLILWYDYQFDNPWNRDVKGVKRREIHQLFRGCEIDLRSITLAQPLARALAPYSRFVCCVLEKLPLLCTHYLGVIRKTRPGSHESPCRPVS